MTTANTPFTRDDFDPDRMFPYFGTDTRILDIAARRGFSIVRNDFPDDDDSYYAILDRGCDTLAVCHLDTVNRPSGPSIEDDIIASPVVDNRLGVYIIMELLAGKGIHSDILLTTGEETGRSTALLFDIDTDRTYNWMYSFDRKGEDVALYQYKYNQEWTHALSSAGFELSDGISSDIAYLGNMGCAAANVGIGYNESFHSVKAYVDIEIMLRQLNRFTEFWRRNHAILYNHHPRMIPS